MFSAFVKPGGNLTARRDRSSGCGRPGGDRIHPHDAELVVANALAAVEAGATLVQGCLNGCRTLRNATPARWLPI
jgi:hypothetical protein